MEKIKKTKYVFLFAILLTILFYCNSTSYASSEDNIPRVTLSSGIENNLKDFIVTEVDDPELVDFLDQNNLSLEEDSVCKNIKDNQLVFYAKKKKSKKKTYKWNYMYTVDPYSFYKNNKTGEIRVLQTTSTVNHTVGTIVNGVITRGSSWPVPYYNPKFVGLLG